MICVCACLVLVGMSSRAHRDRLEELTLQAELFAAAPTSVPVITKEALTLSNVQADTDGLFLTTCEGFHPDCWLDSEGIRFRVRGLRRGLDKSKYEITYSGSEQAEKRKARKLFSVMISAATESPGISLGLIFETTEHRQHPAGSPEKERQDDQEREICEGYLRLLYHAYCVTSSVRVELKDFKEMEFFSVSSLSMETFVGAFCRKQQELLSDPSEQELLHPAFRSVRTFFQLQHGHRNLVKVFTPTAEPKHMESGAVIERLRGAAFHRFNMDMVTSVSISLGAQVGVRNATIYTNMNFIKAQHGQIQACHRHKSPKLQEQTWAEQTLTHYGLVN